MNKYVIHPLAMLFPEMSQRDFDELKESIRKAGQQEPIITDGITGMVIDGRHRLKACEELGIAPRFRSLLFTDSIEDYIWTHNAVRRHLTDDQRAALATQWVEALEKQAKERQAAGKPPASQAPAGQKARTPSDRHATRTAIAKRANVSTKKARQAITVKKKAPHLVPKVAAGEMKLKEAVKAAKPTSKPAKRVKVKERPTVAPPVKMVVAVDPLKQVTDKIREAISAKDHQVTQTVVEVFRLLLHLFETVGMDTRSMQTAWDDAFVKWAQETGRKVVS